MKIGVINATSQKDKNSLLYECTKNATSKLGGIVDNLGISGDDTCDFSYIQTAFLVSLLLESKAVDFVVTGCSSGQGMALACNSLPGVLCGYIPTPQDAFLFGRINGGNAAALPLGLNFGWCGELNLQYTLDALFCGPFGSGYPQEDAARKQHDSALLKEIAGIVKPPLLEVLPWLDEAFIKSCLKQKNVYEYIMTNSSNQTLLEAVSQYV